MPLPPRIDKGLPKKVKRKRPGDSKAHLAFIRSLPCCVCAPLPNQCGNTEAHHLIRAVDGLPKGMSRKHLDRYAIPLGQRHHLAVFGRDTAHGHGNDEEWLADNGIDGRALADSLWRAFNKHDNPEDRLNAGLRIIGRCKQVERA